MAFPFSHALIHAKLIAAIEIHEFWISGFLIYKPIGDTKNVLDILS